ncbi:MAG: hypothetical protein JO036_18195 [Candidatus Eremiobacteraeota bacterium]|nr:hypothetical protein [Candidatus Eremiobacteraeota bacterium]
MDFRFPYKLTDLRKALGEPTVFTYGAINGREQGTCEGFRFPCGCEATPVQAAQYTVTTLCTNHSTQERDTVRVSDRRLPHVFGRRLSYQAMGLLTELIAAQEGAPTIDGCVEMTFPPAAFVGQEESVRVLVDARILEDTGDGHHRLLVFNCWDNVTREWY